MRGLYWLTAVTLVAAAVTTVAIADYGRRHPQTAAAWWNATAQTTTPVRNTTPSTDWVSEEMASGTTHTSRQAVLPPLPDTAHPDLVPAKPLRVEDVPEHQQLRDAALNSLASTTIEVPVLPPANPKTPVVDEFTYSEKPLTPLYVPIQPDSKVVLPPASVLKETAKLPVIPGVSLNQAPAAQPRQLTSAPDNQFLSLPDYRTKPGPEVMPGLHAARPVTPDADNPVMDSMLAFGELITAMNPVTYLLAVPMDKKTAKVASNFASTDVKPVVTGPVCCDDLKTCPTPTAATKSCTPGNCCKNASAADEVVVRTYSVADFANTAAGHEDLVRLITTMVAPDTWQTRDSNVEYFAQGKCLVIRHRTSVQEQVDDLLTQLRSQVTKQGKTLSVAPAVRHEPTLTTPLDRELVPLAPRECSERLPRVITNEPTRCVGDDAFFGMIPLRADGRLMPVPMTQLEMSALVPAQFNPKVNEPVMVEEGPVLNHAKPRAPEFFPWFLPYAPLPQGPQHCEEELLKRVGFVSYSDDEIAFLFLMACEGEETR